jgi:hypothetical protein
LLAALREIKKRKGERKGKEKRGGRGRGRREGGKNVATSDETIRAGNVVGSNLWGEIDSIFPRGATAGERFQEISKNSDWKFQQGAVRF